MISEDEAVEEFKGLVEILAWRFTRTTAIDLEDLMQIGMIGVIKACRTYNETRGATLKTWADTCIRREIIEAFRAIHKTRNKGQRPIFVEVETPETHIERVVTVTPDYDDYLEVHTRLARLPKFQRELLTWRYMNEANLKVIGQRIGKSEVMAGRLVAGAIADLRREGQGKGELMRLQG